MVLTKEDIGYIVVITGLILCVSVSVWPIHKQFALFAVVISGLSIVGFQAIKLGT